MREFDEQDAGDDADDGVDSSPDAVAGRSGSCRPAVEIVRDPVIRAALALDYRQRVKGAEGAQTPRVEGTASMDDRGDRAPWHVWRGRPRPWLGA